MVYGCRDFGWGIILVEWHSRPKNWSIRNSWWYKTGKNHLNIYVKTSQDPESPWTARRSSSKRHFGISFKVTVSCYIELVFGQCRLHWRTNRVKLISHFYLWTTPQFSLGDFKAVKGWPMTFEGLKKVVLDRIRSNGPSRAMKLMRTAFLKAANPMLPTTEEMYPVSSS